MEIGKVAGATALDLVKNEGVLNKTTNLMGMLLPYAGLTKRALDMYIADIEKSNMSSESKLIAVLNAKDTIKKLKNQKKVAEIAVENAAIGTDFTSQSGVNEEWLERFMDSAGFVSADDIQVIWGKILGKEFENPGTTPLNMTRILSEITPIYAQAFRKLCSMQGMIIEMDDEGNILCVRKDVIVPYTDNKEKLKKIGLSFDIVNELETLGLIKFDPLSGYAFSDITSKNVLCYIDGKTEVITKCNHNLIPSGNILLTAAGKCLESITPLEKIEGYKDMVKQFFQKNGIEFMEESNYRVVKNGAWLQIEKV